MTAMIQNSQKFLLFFTIFFVSCDPPPDPRKKSPVKIIVEKKTPEQDLPWQPPMDLPAKDQSDIPKHMKPRPSRFSRKMWRLIKKYEDDIISHRRALHAKAELAWREVKTVKYLKDQLGALGINKFEPAGLTGFAAVIRGNPRGATVGFLFGIDGSPESETTGLTFASNSSGYWENRKVMVSHAYGRDMEMAIALGAARVLTEMKNKLNGNVVFLFQGASSRVQSGEHMGATDVISSGVLGRLGVDVLYHMPLDPGIKTGKIGVPTGAVHGGLSRFSIIIKGVSSHMCSGTVPWKCTDPVSIAASLVSSLLILPTRKFGPNHQVILNIGKLHAGEASHTMASRAVIGGTFRWLIENDRRKMTKLIKNAVEGAKKSSGAKVSVNFTKGPQMTVGNTRLTEWTLGTLVRSLGRHGVLPGDPLSDPGDFTKYHKELPTSMFLLGCSGSKFANRRGSGSFNPDEESLSVGVHVLVNIVMDYLHAPNPPSGEKGKKITLQSPQE
ncbi:MAG: amidohydrolase [Deltaproteobacteria bacterium]|nr:amidohydrolase [Deltaproteobacteria bacterium]